MFLKLSKLSSTAGVFLLLLLFFVVVVVVVVVVLGGGQQATCLDSLKFTSRRLKTKIRLFLSQSITV